MEIVQHDDDPGIDPLNYNFEELLKIYEDYEPVGWGVLVRVYKPIRQEKTKGGVYLSDIELAKQDHASKFYNFIGLVIKIAPGVYKETEKYHLTGAYCKPGDWVQFSRSEGNSFAWKGLTSLRVEEDRILARITSPIHIKALTSGY